MPVITKRTRDPHWRKWLYKPGYDANKQQASKKLKTSRQRPSASSA